MTIDQYIKKKHAFKCRLYQSLKFPSQTYHNYQHVTIYTPKLILFEIVYLRFFRKLFRRRYMKAKLKFFKPRLWLYLKVNNIVSSKSKNARMGAGVGSYIRLNIRVKAGRCIARFIRVTPINIKWGLQLLKYRYPWLLMYYYNRLF